MVGHRYLFSSYFFFCHVHRHANRSLWPCAGPGLPSRPIQKKIVLTGHTQGVLDVALSDDYIVSWYAVDPFHFTSVIESLEAKR